MHIQLYTRIYAQNRTINSPYTDVKTDSEADLETAVVAGLVILPWMPQAPRGNCINGIVDGTCGTHLNLIGK